MVWKWRKQRQVLSQSRKTKFPIEENSKLKLSNDEETKDPNKILEEEKSFYKNLYATKNVDADNSEFDMFFNNNLLTPRNEELSKKCEGTCMLSKKECHVALNKGYGQWQIN